MNGQYFKNSACTGKMMRICLLNFQHSKCYLCSVLKLSYLFYNEIILQFSVWHLWELLFSRVKYNMKKNYVSVPEKLLVIKHQYAKWMVVTWNYRISSAWFVLYFNLLFNQFLFCFHIKIHTFCLMTLQNIKITVGN